MKKEATDASNRRRGKGRRRSEVQDSFSFDVLKNDSNQDRSTAELDGHFVHSQLIIDCLQRMKSTSKEIEEFVESCRDHKDFKGGQRHLHLLDEFRKEYSSEKSLWWYTRDSFVYRMLNKALRAQNIDILFLFRFFIRDLGEQLKRNQWMSPGSAYRGQSLSKDELNRLRQSVGTVISINSFLSTTLYRDVANFYIGGTSEQLEKVLFKINFNPLIEGIKPFADVTLISEFPDEGEILFMLGSIFRIDRVDQDEQGTWTIELNLCSDHDQVLKPIFRFLRQESNRCELDLLAFGNVLHDMGVYDGARSYYDRCLKLLPADDQIWRPYCYYLLGLIATEDGDGRDALRLLHQSLQIRTQTLPAGDPSLADTRGAIARLYYISSHLEQALAMYNKALVIFQQAFGEDDLTSAMSYTNIGVVYKAQRKYTEALDYHLKALAIRKKHLPPDHFRFGTSYNNIGEVYQGLEQYDVALEYYELAREVFKKSLPSQHVDRAILLVNIGSVHVEKSAFTEALSFYKAALGICRSVWPVPTAHLLKIEGLVTDAEKSPDSAFPQSLGDLWTKLFRPFKCIASLDPRTAYRQARLAAQN